MDFIDHRSTANFIFSLSATDEKFRITNNGDVGIGTSSPSTKLEVNGVITTAGLTTTADINFGDNDKAIFGAGSDLQIYHDGTDSYITDTTGGNLFINEEGAGYLMMKGSDLYFRNPSNADMIHAQSGGYVKLYHNASEKLATTSTGIDVTGTVTADGLTVEGSSAGGTYITSSSGSAAGDVKIEHIINSSRNLNTINSESGSGSAIALALATGETKRLNIASNGDISFYEDTGTTAKLFWDASAESLFIGATSASALNSYSDDLIISNTTFGTGAGISIVSNATNGYSNIHFGDTDDADIARIQYNNADNKMTFRTNTSDALTIDSSQNVGIGTSSPSGLLHIASTGASNIKLEDTDNGFTATELNIENGGRDFKITTPQDTIFVQGSTEAMRILSGGNVGIGTSSPDTLLHLSDTAGGAVIRLERNDTSIVSTDVYGEIQFEGQDASAGSAAGIRGKILGVAEGATGEMALAFQTASGYSSSTERMRIDSSGNVGIGTSSPASALEVIGTDPNNNVSRVVNIKDDRGYAADVGGGISLLGKYNSSGGYSTFAHIIGAKTNGTDGDYSGYLAFKTRSASALPAERMRIDSSGNLLVGNTVTNPSSNYSNQRGFAYINSTGKVEIATTANDVVMDIGKNNTNDGSLVAFRKEGTVVGSISSRAGTVLSVILDPRTGGAGLTAELGGLRPTDQTGAITDNAIDLGKNTGRFKDLYLSGGLRGDTLTFKNLAGSERTRIDSSGNQLWGKTSADNTTQGIRFLGSSGFMSIVRSNDNLVVLNRIDGDGTIMEFRTNGTTQGSISISGSTTSYNTSSDQRLKDNIVDAPSASDDIDAIQVRSFDWKADGSHQKYGMVAQELQNVAPEAVTGDADSDDMMGVDYSKLVPMMLKEIQSLRARVAQLEGEN